MISRLVTELMIKTKIQNKTRISEKKVEKIFEHALLYR